MPGGGARRAFITSLHAAAATRQGPEQDRRRWWVLGVRADFEARCAGYPQLAEAVQDRYLLLPMTGRQFRMVITGPAPAPTAEIMRAWMGDIEDPQ